jgi:hypothetical protein
MDLRVPPEFVGVLVTCSVYPPQFFVVQEQKISTKLQNVIEIVYWLLVVLSSYLIYPLWDTSVLTVVQSFEKITVFFPVNNCPTGRFGTSVYNTRF